MALLKQAILATLLMLLTRVQIPEIFMSWNFLLGRNCGFVEATLCTTLLVQSYVVHQPV